MHNYAVRDYRRRPTRFHQRLGSFIAGMVAGVLVMVLL